MIKLTLTTLAVLACTIGAQAMPLKKLQISIGNQFVTFTPPPY